MKHFGQTIPELSEIIGKYGCRLIDRPPYVLVGQYNSASGPITGIVAAAMNEFHAHILRREINKNGVVVIENSEHHLSPTFSIAIYKKSFAELHKKESI
jgi:hypothetical protein